MNASLTARQRVRAELIREITEIARGHLATEGAGRLSLRAVARDMGMVSSAIYRYFPSRDDLLTALIIDGYNALGAAVEQAGAAASRDDYPGRWLACCRAVRAWALAHPHEYALLYGSPVPGYRAPEQTIAPAARAAAVFGAVVSEAHRDGMLTAAAGTAVIGGGGRSAGAQAGGPGAAAHPPAGAFERTGAGSPGWPPLPASFAPDAAGLRDAILAGVTDEVAARTLAAWAGLFGLVSFELFGQFENVVSDRDAFFGYAAACLGRFIGLPA